MSHRAWLLLLSVAVAACARAPSEPAAEPAAEPPAPTVAAAAETAPTVQDGANAVAIWVHPEDGAKSLILGAGGTGGLEVYGLDGTLRQRISDIEASHVTLRYGFDLGGRAIPLALVYDPMRSLLIGYTVDAAGKVARLPGAPLAVDDELTGLCSYRSAVTGRSYALGMTDSGEMLQWELFAKGDALDGRLVRTVALGKGIEYCAVDDGSGTVYYGDEALGLVSLPVGVETDPARSVVDMAAPRGGLAEEVKGIALAQGADGKPFVVVSDASAERFAIYGPEGKRLGRFQVGAGGAVDAVGETEGLAIATAPMGDAYPEGILVTADQDNDGSSSNFKIAGWREARNAGGVTATGFADPRAAVTATAARTVTPTLETPAVATWGDAADDPAIWVNARDPAKSAVVGTDKNLGLYVYDLEGRLLQTVADGRMNNVDLRDGFLVDGKPRVLVAASNRTDKTLTLYFLDPTTRKLTRAGEPVPTGLADPYGLCMYAGAGGHYVYINNGEDGLFRQWRITASNGHAVAQQVRDFTVGSQAEGCAADDETGALYIAEEDGGFFRYSAAPDGGSERREIDRVDGPNGLKADIEGVEIWAGKDGNGFIVLSNQGADNYAVYRREGDNAFVGLFHIVADPARGIDGVSETDGLDVVSAPLGARFPDGLLVVQDGRNLSPREKQNFKFVSWREIAQALGLN
jgi:3-phytase